MLNLLSAFLNSRKTVLLGSAIAATSLMYGLGRLRTPNMVNDFVDTTVDYGSLAGYFSLQGARAVVALGGLIANATLSSQQRRGTVSYNRLNGVLLSQVIGAYNDCNTYMARRQVNQSEHFVGPDGIAMADYIADLAKEPASFSQRFAAAGKAFEQGHEFLCPIELEVMDKPVKLVETHVNAEGVETHHNFYYNYQALKSWFETGHTTNPANRTPFSWQDVRPAPELVEKMRAELAAAQSEQPEDRALNRTRP